MPVQNPKAWGPLKARYETVQPRKMLALDGGGIRGILTLQILAALESELAQRYSRGDYRLCEFFDYVGGTSTGAIIAAAIARGMRIPEIISFYESFGKVAFTKRKWYERWKSLYGDGELQHKLVEVYGEDTKLYPNDLKTLLLVVTRNTTTDSAWPISSNPEAKYNDATRPDCNLQIPLWKIVRASTAAPVFFPPETIQWDTNDDSKDFVFVDGGTTPYNNPAFLMVRMATEPAYKLEWERGEDKLLVVSVGTGSTPALGPDADDGEGNLISGATNTLSALMSQAEFDQDLNCRTTGHCTHGNKLDREVGDLVFPASTDLGRAFLYARYNVELTKEGLAAIGISGMDAKAVSAMDAVEQMGNLIDVGKAVAEQVSLDHLGSFV